MLYEVITIREMCDAAIENAKNAKRKIIYGEESLESAESMNDLAMVLREQGDYDQSEKLLTASLSIRKKLLPVESPEVAQSINNLGLLKEDMGELEEAKKLLEESLHIKEKIYGKIHPSVTSYNFV